MINIPQYVIVILILIGTIANAYCDKGISRNIEWWHWHIPKWIHFNVVYGVLLVSMVKWIWWIPVILVCWILWNLVYRGFRGFIEKIKEVF